MGHGAWKSLPACLVVVATGAAAQIPNQLAKADARLTASAEAVVEAIEACRTRLDPQIDIGYERIAARCPDLARRLEQNSFAAWLPEGWKDAGNNLSAGSLGELGVLIQREIATQSSRPAPSVQHLPNVLAEIGQSARQRDGLLKRIRLWLHKVLPSTEEPADSGWISRMVSRIGLSQTLIELVSAIALIVVIGLSALILTNELRAARFLRKRRRREASEATTPIPAASSALTWQDVDQAEYRDKPRILLALLIERLTQTRRLPPAHSLTARELTRSAKLPERDDYERLAYVALTAERIKYAAGTAQPAEIDAAIAGGRELLRAIDPAAKSEAVQ
jgi:hypothetical protein